LKENEFLTDEAFEEMTRLSSKEISKPLTIQHFQPEQNPDKRKDPFSVTLRILCIQRDAIKDNIPYIGLDKDGDSVCGTIDRVHVRDEMASDSMIKCMTNHAGKEQEHGYYVNVDINDSVELLPDDPSFLKVWELKSKIEDINTTKRDYVLEAVVVDGPFADPEESDRTGEATLVATVGDETGLIDLVEYGGHFIDNLNKGDKVRITGALSTNSGIQLSPYGVIEKTGVLDDDSIEKLRRGTRIVPPKKAIPIGEGKEVPDGLQVTLQKMHVLDNVTRLFLTVDNTRGKDESSLWDARLIQGKKQFEREHTGGPYRGIKYTIPAGVEETGVLSFEPLDDSLEPVRVVLKFFVGGSQAYLFDFERIKISG
jgi:hypothetical protein